MRLISAIMNLYWSHTIALQKLSNERSYKFSWILTLTEVISIRILRMRIFSTIKNFYWSHAIALQKLSNERSYKFSRIWTLTEVISIRILRVRLIWTQRSLNRISKKYWWWQATTTTNETAFQYSRLWINKSENIAIYSYLLSQTKRLWMSSNVLTSWRYIRTF